MDEKAARKVAHANSAAGSRSCGAVGIGRHAVAAAVGRAVPHAAAVDILSWAEWPRPFRPAICDWRKINSVQSQR